MQVAIPSQGSYTITDHAQAWPDTSFSVAGPNAEFLAEQGAYPVTDWLAHDPDTQRLAPIAPTLIDGTVVTVEVVQLTAAEIRARTVPQSVTMASARIVLLRAGITDAAVRAQIASMPEPQSAEALIAWEFRATVRRDSDLVAGLGPALGLTDAQIDGMFIAAAVLDAE